MTIPTDPGQVQFTQGASSEPLPTTGQPQGALKAEDVAMQNVGHESGVVPGSAETPSHVQGSADHKDMGSPERAQEQQPAEKTLKPMVKSALGALDKKLGNYPSTAGKAIKELATNIHDEVKGGYFLENRKAELKGLADKASLKTGIGLDSKIDQKRSEVVQLDKELKALKDNKEQHVGHYTAELAQVREQIKDTAARIKDPTTESADRDTLERAKNALEEKEGKLEAAISGYDGKIEDAETKLKNAQGEWKELAQAKDSSIKEKASSMADDIKTHAENLMGRVRTLDLKGGVTQLAGKIGKAVTAKFAQLKGTFQTLARNVESRVRGNADEGSHTPYEVPMTPQDHGASHLGQLPPPPKKAEDEGKEVQAEEHETSSAQGQVGGATDSDTPQVSRTSTPTPTKEPTNEDEGGEVDNEQEGADTGQGQVSSPQTSTASRVQGGVEEKEGTEGETEAVQGGDVSQTLQGRVDSNPPSDEAKISTGRKISKAIVKPFKAIKNLATDAADKAEKKSTDIRQMDITDSLDAASKLKGKKREKAVGDLSAAFSESAMGAFSQVTRENILEPINPMVLHSQGLSNFAKHFVMEGETEKDVESRFNLMRDVAVDAMNRGDFHTAKAIAMGLDHGSITNLLGADQMKELSQMIPKGGTEQTALNERNSKATIPFLGSYKNEAELDITNGGRGRFMDMVNADLQAEGKNPSAVDMKEKKQMAMEKLLNEAMGKQSTVHSAPTRISASISTHSEKLRQREVVDIARGIDIDKERSKLARATQRKEELDGEIAQATENPLPDEAAQKQRMAKLKSSLNTEKQSIKDATRYIQNYEAGLKFATAEELADKEVTSLDISLYDKAKQLKSQRK